jgi:phospholipid/cholesterol/gamma-HCH transport system permease protein
MRVTEQIDALVSLATNPIRYLVIPRVLACVLLLPCLTIFAIFIGIFASYAFGVHWLGVPEIFFVKNLQNFVKFSDVASGLIKSIPLYLYWRLHIIGEF